LLWLNFALNNNFAAVLMQISPLTQLKLARLQPRCSHIQLVGLQDYSDFVGSVEIDDDRPIQPTLIHTRLQPGGHCSTIREPF
jgi:hypothetical protein